VAGIDTETLTRRVSAAYALIDAHDREGAIVGLEAVVADAPQFELALLALGDAYHEVGREVDAVRMLERALEVEAQDGPAINALFYRTQVAQKILDGLDPNKPIPSTTNA
jgi:Tfp pilus assembly protein PilF